MDLVVGGHCEITSTYLMLVSGSVKPHTVSWISKEHDQHTSLVPEWEKSPISGSLCIVAGHQYAGTTYFKHRSGISTWTHPPGWAQTNRVE